MIKSKLNPPKDKESFYPMLMSDRSAGKNIVVLFYGRGVGVVVHSNTSDCPIGHHSSCWNMLQFTPYDGDITLTNK